MNILKRKLNQMKNERERKKELNRRFKEQFERIRFTLEEILDTLPDNGLIWYSHPDYRDPSRWVFHDENGNEIDRRQSIKEFKIERAKRIEEIGESPVRYAHTQLPADEMGLVRGVIKIWNDRESLPFLRKPIFDQLHILYEYYQEGKIQNGKSE